MHQLGPLQRSIPQICPIQCRTRKSSRTIVCSPLPMSHRHSRFQLRNPCLRSTINKTSPSSIVSIFLKILLLV
uniref:Uncharacterized protein n=1 Tax=Manihot esculenta TaxID=3983 RepID=A0A2C9UVN3_MANES